MNTKENCKLCYAVDDSLNNHRKTSIFNICLIETESFLVMPCIGPLINGHILIVSKNHYKSLAAMPEETHVEIKNILKIIFNKGILYKESLIFEHGAFDDQKGGSCIEHTHIHVIPKYGKYFNLLNEVLPVTKISGMDEIFTLEEPYIFCTNYKGDFMCFTAYNSQSQMVRAAICNKLNRSDFHWATNERRDLVLETIKYWEKSYE